LGFVSEYMIAMDELRSTARDVANAAGAIGRCPIHEEVDINQGDPAAESLAYRIANARISRNEIGLPEGVSRRDFTDMIKELVEESCDDCPECERIAAM
jgi:hypothetical protein